MGKTVAGNVPQLKILVVKAIGLPAADVGGTSDPYVQIQVGHDYGWNPKVWKTSKLKKTLNPIWNEEFLVPVASPEKDSVRLAVFDYDFIGSDDLLGQVVFPDLHKLPLGVPTEAVLTLTGLHSSRGTINVVFTALNFGVQGPTIIQTTTAAPAPVAVAVAPVPVATTVQTTTTAAYNPYGAPVQGYPAGAAGGYAPIPAPGSPYGQPVSPYGVPSPAPYSVPNMYGAPMYPGSVPSYGAPGVAPAANPYGAPPPGNPYGAPAAANPYGAPPPGNPYGAPPAY